MLKARILVVDDEEIARDNLTHVLQRDGFEVVAAASGAEALSILSRGRIKLLLTDLRMGGMDGLALMREAREKQPNLEVVVITAHASTESAVDAMRAGAFYYIEKPFRLPEVRKIVREALEKVSLKEENASLKSALSQATGASRVITQSPVMQGVLATAAQVAPTDCAVLIVGETGTGKEVVARYIHENSHRATRPFLALNCGALSDELLANELFGHERGAFTGATGSKSGLIETAAGGTLFLDEVTEMSASIQVKLLRVLQEREFFRLGGREAIASDVRIVAATNRDPLRCIEEGTFRQDLYFRLNVVGISLPPLRERKGDIPLLALHFLAKGAQKMGKNVVEITPEAFECLLAHSFQGNVRELENIIDRGIALSTGTAITRELLPPEIVKNGDENTDPGLEGRIPTLAEIEARHIKRVLEHTDGNRLKAAALLGIDRVSLWRKLRHKAKP